MKLKIFLFTCIFAVFSLTFAQAADFESLLSSNDADEICLLEDDLIAQINSIIEQESPSSKPMEALIKSAHRESVV